MELIRLVKACSVVGASGSLSVSRVKVHETLRFQCDVVVVVFSFGAYSGGTFPTG